MSRPIPGQIKKPKKTNINISEMVDMEFILEKVAESLNDIEENEPENNGDE